MYKTKMTKVYRASFQFCISIAIANLIVLGIKPVSTIAQGSISSTDIKQAANNATETIEPEILSEINRVRTEPQNYARWLEEQRQYYDGVWLRLPGEKPIRTNKGLKALEEAIAILKEQPPLSPLSKSEAAAAVATDKLDNFATAKNIQYISYGRTTPQGIVMSLVVDDLFPDRRRRKSLLSPNANNTGVVCKPDPTYAKVCAIAYSDSPVEVAEAESTEVKPEPENNTEPVAETETTEDTLPAPPIPPTPPIPDGTEVEEPVSEEEETEVAQTDSEEVEEPEELEEPVSEEEETEVAQADSEEVEEPEEPEEPVSEEEETEVAQADSEEVEESEEPEETVATNSDSSRILENVERGVLEEGDLIIAEDGSFYDSYPLQGESGESFIISLESDKFDAFVALVDARGNIIEQNDDIDEENSNSQIRVTIPEDGTYNIIVNAYDEGGTGEYILTIRR